MGIGSYLLIFAVWIPALAAIYLYLRDEAHYRAEEGQR